MHACTPKGGDGRPATFKPVNARSVDLLTIGLAQVALCHLGCVIRKAKIRPDKIKLACLARHDVPGAQ